MKVSCKNINDQVIQSYIERYEAKTGRALVKIGYKRYMEVFYDRKLTLAEIIKTVDND